MNMDLSNKYSKALEVCVQNSDHAGADAILCELLTVLGYRSVCEVHSRVNNYPRPLSPPEIKIVLDTIDTAKTIDEVAHNRKSKK